jgi:hypothetical protein
MADKENDLIKRVLETMPGIKIDSFEINQEGLINDVVIISRAPVFRFFKNRIWRQYP